MSAPRPQWINTIAPYAGILAFGIIAAMLPRFSPTGEVMSLATTVVVWSIAASGFGFLWGQSGQMSLAHAAIFGLGAYTAAICAKFWQLGFVAALPLSIVVGMLAASLIVLPSLRTQGHYFVILTFAIGEVIAVFEKRLDNITGGANGILVSASGQEVFGLRLTNRADFYVLCVGFATVVLLMLMLMMRSRWGTTLRGLRENADLAASLGVNVVKHRLFAFLVSGAVAGLGGQLYLYQVKFIAPMLFTTQASIIFLLVVLLGGKTYLLGPTIGAFVYFFLSHFLGLPPIVNQMVFGAILVVMILLTPDGLPSLFRRVFKRRPPADPAPAEARA